MSDLPPRLDLLCVGRLGVDFYGEQIGAGLASTETFTKSVGGSAANICVGTSRLGLRTAMCSRVGDEPFGRSCRDILESEGVDVSAIQVDPERPTGLVALALHALDEFPRIFFYRDSADLAFEPSAFDWALAERCRAVLLTGSFLARAPLADFQAKLAAAIRERGGRVVLDIDYRPVLFGEAPIGRGQQMTGGSPRVSEAFMRIVPFCDLIVGTEDEVLVASGKEDLASALDTFGAAAADATVVVKRGRLGAIAYPGAVEVPGFDIVVQNTVGAGDGFLSGFLASWLRGEAIESCLRAGNAGGALVASRRGCMPALPSATELSYFLRRGGVERPGDNRDLEESHRMATRRLTPERLFVLAIDHRRQLEEMAAGCGALTNGLPHLKSLFVESFLRVAATRPEGDFGLVLDEQYGAAAFERLDGSGKWIFRSAEVSGSRPLELIGGEDISGELRTWPRAHTAKVMTLLATDDPRDLFGLQAGRLAAICRAGRRVGREVLVELQTPDASPYKPAELPALVARLYEAGVSPEWWKLPPLADAAQWQAIGEVVRANDSSCRGLLVLGAGASKERLGAAFAASKKEPLARGFAVGRSIFAVPTESWLTGQLEDERLVEQVAAEFHAIIALWEES